MSEEMKNLNEQPEDKAPVEEKVEAPAVEKAEAPKLPISKKTLTIIAGAVAAILIVVLVLVLVLGGGKGDNGDVTPDNGDNGDVTPDNGDNGGETVTEKDYTLGLGLVFGDINATQTNATIATVVTDKDGKIVACKLDAVQNKYTIGENGISFTVLDTKKELGDAYGMANNPYSSDNNGDGIIKEWYEQAAIFEQYVIGKTAEELKALELQDVNNHMISSDEALLTAGCTIQIGEFIGAVVKACEDEQSMSFKTAGEIALGLGINSSDNGSTGDDFEASVKMNIDFAATVLVDGKVVATLNDAAQPEVKVEDATNVVSKSVGKGDGILKTKRELKEDYKMAAFGQPNVEGGTVKEWYIQSAAFSNYLVGKTPAEIAALTTKFVNNHYISTDDTLLNAGCTMQITGIKDVVLEAIGYAEYTLGLGLVFGDINATQTNATIATVVIDKDGKIVACKLDAVQNKYTIGENGINFTILDTKKELGDAYGMANSPYSSDNNGDGIIKEWYEQAAIFEQYVIGKTAEELKALELQEVNNHIISKDEALLTAGCTIQIGEFIGAVVKACEDEQGVSFRANGEIALGLGINSSDNGSTGDDFEASVKMNIDFAATVTVDGKIVAALNDAAQPQVEVIDAVEVDSVSVGKGDGILKTKRELGNAYGMADSPYSSDNNGDGIIKEWYIQSAAFSTYIVGLTSEQVAGLETELVNDHYISTDDTLLNAGCTMQITGIQAVVVESIANAR